MIRALGDVFIVYIFNLSMIKIKLSDSSSFLDVKHLIKYQAIRSDTTSYLLLSAKIVRLISKKKRFFTFL